MQNELIWLFFIPLIIFSVLRRSIWAAKDGKILAYLRQLLQCPGVPSAAKLGNVSITVLALFLKLNTSSTAEDSMDPSAYPITHFRLSYAQGEHPSHPLLADIMNYKFEIGRRGEEYVAIEEAVSTDTISLEDFSGSTRYFHKSAIRLISQQIVHYMNQLDIIGVYVEPHSDDIDKKTLADLRVSGNTELRLVIWTSFVKEMRTIASGKRIPADERINNPAHARILALSPLKPSQYISGERADLLRKDTLEEYVFRLNRHPGRRVDIAISSTGETGELVLDYLVSENRPWFTYAQISNTGTEATDTVRERFGIIFNQLSKRDDVLRLDYITAGFSEAHAFLGSYEFPTFSFERLRTRFSGSWSEFTASELGGTFPIDLTGTSWNVGAEWIMNVFQHKNFFVDLIGGVDFENIVVDNKDQPEEGESDFIIPHIELQAEQLSDTTNSFASLDLELIKADLDNGNRDDKNSLGINQLGRLDIEEEPFVMHWNIQHSFYLEPLLFRKGWKDSASWKTSTLAHELALSFRGQYSFGTRLIPQKQMTVGGFYTVRGYEESDTVGDDAYIGSIEYRFHVPRAFKPGDPKNLFPKSLSRKRSARKPKAFKFVPDRVYGRPDWDLILRTFYDIGDTEVTDRQTNEFDETLQSVGIGAELQFMRYLNVRLDWGIVLEDLDGSDAESGDNRVHVAATFLW